MNFMGVTSCVRCGSWIPTRGEPGDHHSARSGREADQEPPHPLSVRHNATTVSLGGATETQRELKRRVRSRKGAGPASRKAGSACSWRFYSQPRGSSEQSMQSVWFRAQIRS